MAELLVPATLISPIKASHFFCFYSEKSPASVAKVVWLSVAAGCYFEPGWHTQQEKFSKILETSFSAFFDCFRAF